MFKISKGIYVILDNEVIANHRLDLLALADKVARAGADIFQLRAKNISDKDYLNLAKGVARIMHKRKKIFIVNDRPDIAYLCGAGGLHLGASDLLPGQARKIVGRKAIIGKTAHSLKELLAFQKEDIDYLAVGPVFKTKTKPTLPALSQAELAAMINKARKSIFAIGGITLYNIPSLSRRGIKNIALCRGLILRADYKAAVNKFKQCLKKAS